MEKLVPGSLIVQATTGAGTTGPELLYSATLQTEITRVMVANTQATTASFRLYHDDDGVVYSTNSALYFNKQVAPADTLILDAGVLGGGITVSKGGTIGAQSSATGAVTFSLYGITQEAR